MTAWRILSDLNVSRADSTGYRLRSTLTCASAMTPKAYSCYTEIVKYMERAYIEDGMADIPITIQRGTPALDRLPGNNLVARSVPPPALSELSLQELREWAMQHG